MSVKIVVYIYAANLKNI